MGGTQPLKTLLWGKMIWFSISSFNKLTPLEANTKNLTPVSAIWSLEVRKVISAISSNSSTILRISLRYFNQWSSSLLMKRAKLLLLAVSLNNITQALAHSSQITSALNNKLFWLLRNNWSFAKRIFSKILTKTKISPYYENLMPFWTPFRISVTIS